MSNVLDRLRSCNRTLLELRTGIVALGLFCEIFVVIFCKRVAAGSASLFLGVVLAIISTESIYRSLDSALDYDEDTARKKIYVSYLIRYFSLVVIFAILCMIKDSYPLLVFLGYMMLKAGALIQPFTHKIFNRIFHETDPVPVTEEEAIAAREAASKMEEA